MERYVRKFGEDVNDDIDSLISMIMSKKFDMDTYVEGLAGLVDKYDAGNNKEFKGLKAMLVSYRKNPSKRNILSKEIVKEYEFLVN